MTDRNVSADSAPRMESRHPTGRMPSSVDGRIAMPAPVRDVRDYCESMGEDLDDFESDVGANYKLRYEVQEIDTASERKNEHPDSAAERLLFDRLTKNRCRKADFWGESAIDIF